MSAPPPTQPPPQPTVLILGGHGKVARLMTPLLLARGHNVTSVVRNPAHVPAVMALQPPQAPDGAEGVQQGGKLRCLIRDLEAVGRDEHAAAAFLAEVRATPGYGAHYILWLASAGGPRGPSSATTATHTYALDRDACKAFTSASYRPSAGVEKFLLLSTLLARRTRAPWWTDADWALASEVQTRILPDWVAAKTESAEFLTALGSVRRPGPGGRVVPVVVRPGWMSDEGATGRVRVGRTGTRGMVTRGDVAAVAVRLLGLEVDGEGGWKGGWVDVLAGNERVDRAVEKFVREDLDAVFGENVELMKKRAGVT